MQPRALLWVCLGLNVLLATIIGVLWRRPAPATETVTEMVQAMDGGNPARPRVVVRRPGFTWSEVESPDFATYIKNLRNIGCPEKTIRDVIVAEVNELFGERLARELRLPEQKWWEADPDLDVIEAGVNQVRALEVEKAQLLTTLLGAGWDTHKSNPGVAAIRFDGPVLGQLAPEGKAAIERIEAGARNTRDALQQKAREENREITNEELTRLRQDTRRELATIMNPQQMEEYLLRYSTTADLLRDQLRGAGVGADDFRRIFRVRDSYEQQLAAISGNDAGSVARRAELERTRDEAIRQAIGQERYAMYELSKDPTFKQAQEAAEQAGAEPEKVLPIMRIRQEVQREIARIQSDPTISDDQRRVALAAVQQQQSNSIERILQNESADPSTEAAEQAAALQAQREPERPPFPVLPGAFGTPQPSREGLPPGADLPPGVNETTKGPGFPGGRRDTFNTQPTPGQNPKGPAYPSRR